jgi:hypothetical protein
MNPEHDSKFLNRRKAGGVDGAGEGWVESCER